MNKMNIVMFDMDNTLVSEDTVFLWEKFLDRKGITTETDKKFRKKLDDDYWQGCLNLEEHFGFEISVIKRIPVAQRKQWVNEFFHYLVRPKISVKGLKLIEEYKCQKDTLIILITATLSYLAQPVANGANVDHLIATEGEMINGDYTGRIDGIASIGKGKIDRFNSWALTNKISPQHTTYYGDSINDVPLLEVVNKPIAVDPEEKLKKIALTNNWEIISLK